MANCDLLTQLKMVPLTLTISGSKPLRKDLSATTAGIVTSMLQRITLKLS